MGLGQSVVAPDGTRGTTISVPDAYERVQVAWENGQVSWSQKALLRWEAQR